MSYTLATRFPHTHISHPRLRPALLLWQCPPCPCPLSLGSISSLSVSPHPVGPNCLCLGLAWPRMFSLVVTLASLLLTSTDTHVPCPPPSASGAGPRSLAFCSSSSEADRIASRSSTSGVTVFLHSRTPVRTPENTRAACGFRPRVFQAPNVLRSLLLRKQPRPPRGRSCASEGSVWTAF